MNSVQVGEGEAAATFAKGGLQGFAEDGVEDKRLIRQVLHAMGLRGTLIRVRLVALLLVAGEAGSSVAAIHARLEADSGMPLRTLNTYEVLRRLARMGVLSASQRGTYSVSPATLAMVGGLLAEKGTVAAL
jgi:hypothetical protein